MSDDPLTFGERLMRLRAARGLSMRQLARRVGCSHVAIWHWEVDNVEPKAEALARLARALDIGMAELWGSGLVAR